MHMRVDSRHLGKDLHSMTDDRDEAARRFTLEKSFNVSQYGFNHSSSPFF